MRRAFKILRAFVLISVALTAILVVGIWAFTQTDLFRALLRRQVTTIVGDAIPGELRIGAIEGSIWSDFTLRDVALDHDGRRPVEIGSARLAFSLPSLLSGRLQVAAVELSRPVVEVREGPQGEIALLEAVVPPSGEDPAAEEGASGALPIEIAIESIRIRDGRVAVRLADGDLRDVDVAGVDLRASADLRASGLVVDVGELSLRAEAAGLPAVTLLAAARYESDERGGDLSIAKLEARTDRSELVLRGDVRDLERPELDLALAITPLAASDVRLLAPSVRLRRDVEGSIVLAGTLEALRASADLRMGDATLAAEASADVAAESPTVEARLDASNFDLAALLEEEGLAGVVTAHVEVRGSPDAIATARADARLTVDSLVATGRAVGDVSLAAHVEDGRARLEGTVRGDGEARVVAEAGLLGAETYSANLTVDALTLRDLGAGEGGTLNARAEIEGEGYALERARARMNLHVAPSALGEVTLAKADLDATLEGGSVEGTLAFSELRAAEAALGAASIDFRIADVATESRSATAALALERVSAGIALATVEADASYREGRPRTMDLDVRAVDGEKRRHRLRVEGELGEERMLARLLDLSLELVDGTWALAAPSEIVRTERAVTVSELRLTNGGRHLVVEGRAAEVGPQDLSVDVAGVELSSLATFLPERPDVAGVIHAGAALGGTAEAPVFAATARVESLVVEAQAYEGLEAELRYADRVASAEVRFRQDATHALRGDARLPFDLRFAPEITTEPLGPLEASLRSDGLALEFLGAFGAGTFSRVKGELTVDVTVSGPLDALEPRGTLGIRGGGVRLDELDVPVRDIEVAVEFSPTAVVLERLAAKAKKGTLEGKGTVALRDYFPASVSAELSFDEWPAIRTNEYEAHVGGTVRAAGALSSLAIEGDLEVLRGTIRPDLGFLGNQPPKRDETILIVGGPRPTAPPEPAAAAEDGGGAPDLDVYRNATIDVAVAIPGNLWVKQEGSSVELRGEIRAEKAPGRDLMLEGRIVTVRGWVNFQGRRFRIVEGEILLTGGKEIDPRLDVVARHRAGDYTVDIAITGSASKPELELSSDPRLEQADILAVLLFGRPTSALSEGEKSSLSDQAAGLAASFAVAEVSREVTRALGIEELGVQIEEISTDRVAVGAYVAENTFVSVAQDVGGDRGREVSLEYEFLPPNWSVVTSTSTRGESGGDVIWKKRY